MQQVSAGSEHPSKPAAQPEFGIGERSQPGLALWRQGSEPPAPPEPPCPPPPEPDAVELTESHGAKDGAVPHPDADESLPELPFPPHAIDAAPITTANAASNRRSVTFIKLLG